jgi:hypothetical protein
LFILLNIEHNISGLYEQLVQSRYREGSNLRGKASNGLALYKRHSAGCDVHATKLSEPAKRFYFECPCPIWITGTIPGTGDIMPRQATGENDLKKAEAVWDALTASEMQVAATSAVMRPSISACIEQYLAAREHELGEKTHQQDGQHIVPVRGVLAGARQALHVGIDGGSISAALVCSLQPLKPF